MHLQKKPNSRNSLQSCFHSLGPPLPRDDRPHTLGPAAHPPSHQSAPSPGQHPRTARPHRMDSAKCGGVEASSIARCAGGGARPARQTRKFPTPSACAPAIKTPESMRAGLASLAYSAPACRCSYVSPASDTAPGVGARARWDRLSRRCAVLCLTSCCVSDPPGDAGLVTIGAFMVRRARGRDGAVADVARMSWTRACLILFFATSWLFVLSSASLFPIKLFFGY